MEKRGLRINDKALAALWLSRTNYYRFSAYLYPFRNPDDTFKPGTDFSFVCDLYNFDRRLRLLVMDAIERIEIWLRTTLTYEMAHKIGPFGYIRKRNFTKGFKHKEFMGQLLKEIERSKEEFVSHYRDKYTGEKHLPIWMATELLTFGTLSHLYNALPLESKKRVADPIGVDHSVFGGWLHSLAYIRNLCAHHSRVWNRTLAIRPRCPRRWSYGKLDNSKIYLVLVILQHIIRIIAPESTWGPRVVALVNSSPAVNTAAMGFPTGWRDLTPWK